MKKFKIFFIMITTLSISSSYGTPLTGILNQQTTSNNTISNTSIYFYSDIQNYTTGGLTFTYPVGLFSLPPVVNISVQSNASHPTTQTFTAEINANSATSTTVMVYLVNGATVSEAPNGSVTITLFAVADPV